MTWDVPSASYKSSLILLGGKCSLRGKTGKGACITVELPVVVRGRLRHLANEWASPAPRRPINPLAILLTNRQQAERNIRRQQRIEQTRINAKLLPEFLSSQSSHSCHNRDDPVRSRKVVPLCKPFGESLHTVFRTLG